MKDLRVALAITRNPVGAVAENLATLDRWTRSAQKAGARLICFPDLSLTGYTTRKPVETAALTLSDSSVRQISIIARKTGLAILAGLAEKGSAGHLCHPSGGLAQRQGSGLS